MRRHYRCSHGEWAWGTVGTELADSQGQVTPSVHNPTRTLYHPATPWCIILRPLGARFPLPSLPPRQPGPTFLSFSGSCTKGSKTPARALHPSHFTQPRERKDAARRGAPCPGGRPAPGCCQGRNGAQPFPRNHRRRGTSSAPPDQWSRPPPGSKLLSADSNRLTAPCIISLILPRTPTKDISPSINLDQAPSHPTSLLTTEEGGREGWGNWGPREGKGPVGITGFKSGWPDPARRCPGLALLPTHLRESDPEWDCFSNLSTASALINGPLGDAVPRAGSGIRLAEFRAWPWSLPAVWTSANQPLWAVAFPSAKWKE